VNYVYQSVMLTSTRERHRQGASFAGSAFATLVGQVAGKFSAAELKVPIKNPD
jgi:hypothetical protein